MTAEEKKKILFVDDEPDIEKVVRFRLQQAGYEVSVARSGSEALDLARSVKPDLILLDIIIPELNGFEVCRKLREDNETSSIPVVFFTAETADLTAIDDQVELSGAQGYIIKPFSHEELLEIIRRYVK